MKELELVAEEIGTSKEITDPRTLYVPPTSAQMSRKAIDPKQVETVIKNRPMPRIPRSHEAPDDPVKLTERFLARIFPQFSSIFEESKDDGNWKKFDAAIQETIAEHEQLGLSAQAKSMKSQANTYKALRSLVIKESDFLRPDSIIPVEYLPDLFMAVPVWYFWEDPKKKYSENGVVLSPVIQHFANLVPNQRWTDTFLMFNYRLRTLHSYEGDIIPPKISRRMKQVAGLFDYLVIMTPYHDRVSEEWGQMAWQRNIDPYVIGVIKNMPFMLVLGRFSDSGTFPLYSEMVADTIDFLRTNVHKLSAFNRLNSGNFPLSWLGDEIDRYRIGNRLQSHTKELIKNFEKGSLFDWLRGTEAKPA